MIRNVTAADADAIATIYNHYIVNSTCTFEEETVSAQQMAERIEILIDSKMPWLVYEHQGQVIGYCYAKQWNARSAYRFTAESSVYLSPDCPIKGVGSSLYEQLFSRLRDDGIKNVMSVITLPNDQSTRFHHKMGMEQVGHFKQIGFKFDRWLDVGYWQKIL